MVLQVESLVLHNKLDYNYLYFVFFSTLTSYSFHWYFSGESPVESNRLNWLHENRFIHVAFFFLGLSGVLYYITNFIQFWPWFLIAAIATFLYSAPKIPNRYLRQLRKVALGKTLFLAIVWTYVTTVLPAIISNETWETAFTLFIISRFFLIYAICILFDYRDKETDKAAGIRSLITFLSDYSIRLIFVAALFIFGIATLALHFYQFQTTDIIFLLIPGMITGLLYKKATHHFSDNLYYFVLDGLMAFSALLTLIARI